VNTDDGTDVPFLLTANSSSLSPDQTLRSIALHAAVATVGTVATGIAALAEQYLTFLLAGTPVPPFVLTGTAGPILKQPVTKEPTMAIQVPDDSYFILTIAEADSKGVPINTDTLAWTSSDPAVATVDLSVSPSTYVGAIVAGTPGSADVTVTDGATTFVEHVTVVPAGVATMTATEGAILKQPVVPVP
jgi:hypothetical protein